MPEKILNKTPLVLRTRERSFSAHHMLIRAAQLSLETVEKQGPGWFYDALVAMTFSALAVEALCNSVGERLIDNWKSDFESCQPMAKLRILAERQGINFNRSSFPWDGAQWLMAFRNDIAHAKPQLLKVEEEISQEEYDRRLFEQPESKLERTITLQHARRALTIIEALKKILVEQIPLDSADGLAMDDWSGSAEVIQATKDSSGA